MLRYVIEYKLRELADLKLRITKANCEMEAIALERVVGQVRLLLARHHPSN